MLLTCLVIQYTHICGIRGATYSGGTNTFDSKHNYTARHEEYS